MPFFSVAVPWVSQDDTLGVQESMLGEAEGNVVFSLVLDVFGVIPVEPGTLHGEKIAPKGLWCNIIVWLSVWVLYCPHR